MLKLLTYTPIWGRPEIVHVFLENLINTIPDYAEIKHLFVISPEDEYFDVFQKMLKGHEIFVYKNDPLGEKKNAGMRYALELEWDYIVEFGSDNVFTSILWDCYKEAFKTGEKYFGINNLYFVDTVNEKAIFVEGYHKMKEVTPVGAGRCLHRSIFETIGDIWRDSFACGMDGCSDFEMTRNGYKGKVIDVSELPVLLDLKTFTNLNIFQEIERQPHKKVDYFQIMSLFNVHKRNRKQYDILTFDGFHKAVVTLGMNCNKSDAFNSINIMHEKTFGEKRYKNYGSYKKQVTRKFKV